MNTKYNRIPIWRNLSSRLIFTGLIIGLSGCVFLASPVPDIVDVSFTDSYRHDLSTLAADAFMGRKPGTEGGQMTIDYLVNAFEEIGLEPGNGDSYLQAVALKSGVLSVDGGLRVTSPAGEMTLAMWDNMVIRDAVLADQIDLAGKEVVFVGYGATAPEFDWDDYADIDVTGQVVLMLRGDPGFASGDSTIFAGSKRTVHGGRGTKFRNAFAHGALAVITIYDPELSTSTFTWDRIIQYFQSGHVELAGPAAIDTTASMSAYLELNAGYKLLEFAGLDYDSLKVAAYTKGFKSFALPVNVAGRITFKSTDLSTANVLGLLRGTERPDEVIIYTAHWDHVGMDSTLEGDQIYNGASDNATGTAAIINLARAFKAQATPPKRSVLFMCVTAEELGLLGSKFYANHPVYPLNKTVASINIDMLPSYGPTTDVIVFGLGKSDLDNYAKRAAHKLGKTIRGDLRPEENIYFRSDHICLARVGVPSLFAKTGVIHEQFGEEWGLQQVKKFEEHDYHQVTDEYSDTWDLAGIMDHLQLTFDIGYTLANSDKFPNWSKDDDFRVIRDASRAELKGD